MATQNVVTQTNVDAAIPEFWAPSIMFEADKQGRWSRLSGPDGSKAALNEKNELGPGRGGDKINFTILERLLAAATTGTSELKGNEEKINPSVFSVTIEHRRHATSREFMVDVTAIFDYAKSARRQLSDWLARDMDDEVDDQLLNTDTVKTLFAGNRTSRANLGPSDLFVPNELSKLRLAASRRGVNPVEQDKGGRFPFKVFMVMLDEANFYQLTEDADFREDQRLGNLRGDKNPALMGNVTMYKGTLVMVVEAPNPGDGFLGSFFRPEASLSAAINDTTTTITAGPSSAKANVDYWKYFPTSGTNTLRIGNEEITYTSTPTDTQITGVTRGANGTTAASHSANDLITLNNVGKVLAFGPQAVMRAWARRPEPISDIDDYGNELGLGIRYVNGVKGVEATDGTLRNAVVMETYAPNPSTI